MALQWLLLSSLLHVTLGADILAIFPIPGKSHNIVFTSLTRELAHRGHRVTVISPFPEKTPIPNLTEIVVEMKLDEVEFDPLAAGKMSFFDHARAMWGIGRSSCDIFLSHPPVQELIHSKDRHFDLIIVEAFANECFLGFAHKYKAALVQICPYGGTGWMSDWFGNPRPLSYVPEPFRALSDHMTFWERFLNTVEGMYWRLGQEYHSVPLQEELMRKYFNSSGALPSLSELTRSTSLLLVNNHFSLNYPIPLMPNMVQIGGMHIKPPKKLPQDLQRYLDEAEHGVIYFSMGSILQGSRLPESKRQAFLEAFSKLKQKVLWKWETDTLPGQPSNVKLGKWLPQSDILAHPNVRLFITHGGLLGMEEAMTYGVPLLGIPIFGDQPHNIHKAQKAEYGVLLEIENITTESVSWALETVLQPRYRENAQRISRIFRDQPLTPLEQAVFWTEYVIRHKGAPHMRSAALDLSWYQYFLLDVIAVLTLAAGSVLLVFFFIVKALLRKCFGSNRVIESKTVNKSKKLN